MPDASHQFLVDEAPAPGLARLEACASPDGRSPRSAASRAAYGDESQQPTWPQTRHSRSCTGWLPAARHSRQVALSGAGLGARQFGNMRALAHDCQVTIARDADGGGHGRTGRRAMDVMPLLLLVAGSAAVAGAARRTPVPAPLLLVAAGLGRRVHPGRAGLHPRSAHRAAAGAAPAAAHGGARQLVPRSAGQSAAGGAAVGRLRAVRDRSSSAGSPTRSCPDLPLTAALVLGAVVAPPDAVAATAIARRLGLPPRITTILQGESLVNDATAITAYKVALAAAVGEGATWARRHRRVRRSRRSAASASAWS